MTSKIAKVIGGIIGAVFVAMVVFTITLLLCNFILVLLDLMVD